MAQTSALKSAAITNLDATPVVALTTGEGAAGHLREATGFVSTVSADATGSTYRLVRVPSRAIVKRVIFESAAMSGGHLDLSVYYSDSTTDGTQPSLQGLVVPSTGSQFFASEIDCASAVVPTDKTNENGAYPITARNKQLWDALALTSDPGGYFDIVAVCTGTAITTGAAFGIAVQYID